jgi:Uma2 family endonuclease
MRANLTRAAEGFDRRSFTVAEKVAVTSLAYDRNLKARLYARHGVNELWVIDAERRRTFVHSSPAPAGWRTIVERSSDEALALPALPGFSARLGSI